VAVTEMRTGVSLRIRDTVLCATPAAAATSFIVTARGLGVDAGGDGRGVTYNRPRTRSVGVMLDPTFVAAVIGARGSHRSASRPSLNARHPARRERQLTPTRGQIRARSQEPHCGVRAVQVRRPWR